MIERLVGYLAAGGMVMPPLVLIGLALWYLLTLRFLHLRRGVHGSLDEHLERLATGAPGPDGAGAVAGGLREVATTLKVGPETLDGTRTALLGRSYYLGRYRKVIHALTTVSPLLGLLGTVSGMIETFASLGDMALFSRTGGIAAGISEALVSTQMGLLIAIPGMFGSRFLDARQSRLRRELKRLREFVAIQLARAGRDWEAS